MGRFLSGTEKSRLSLPGRTGPDGPVGPRSAVGMRCLPPLSEGKTRNLGMSGILFRRRRFFYQEPSRDLCPKDRPLLWTLDGPLCNIEICLPDVCWAGE